MADVIANCACCGSEARVVPSGRSEFYIHCNGGGCWEGPARNTEVGAIAAWNALMARANPIPEGAVRVEIPVHYKTWDDGSAFAWSGFYKIKTGILRNSSQEPPFATVIAHIVPPKTQEVAGEVK